jgi:L-asparagine oxygenase
MVSCVPKIQTLRPRKPESELMNQYSGAYGTETFPLHSDLAHWRVPPRHFLLRCITGAEDVETTLLSYSRIAATVGEHTLRQALVMPRRKSKQQTICPIPVVFRYEGTWGMRWDFLFLSSLNNAAEETSRIIRLHSWQENGLVAIKLLNSGDTLIVDNWKMLHGRSSVPEGSLRREIQRVYLTKLGNL